MEDLSFVPPKEFNIEVDNHPVRGADDPNHPEFVSVEKAPGGAVPGSGSPTPANAVPDHSHDGRGISKVQLRELSGFIEVVAVIPTHIPRSFWDQVKLYVNGATKTLYVYDYKGNQWIAV